MLESQHTARGRGTRRQAAALLLALVAALGAAPAGAGDTPKDPLERFNRATYAFNDALDRMLARPAAKAYKAVAPAAVRNSVSNFVANLEYPTTIVNDVLQAKFLDAGSDLTRFLANTVIGIGGLFDPATHFGLPIHDEDFGQTLGRWGVPPGPYLMLPVFGPSDFRDAPGRAVDTFTNLEHYTKSTKAEYALWALRQLDRRTQLLATEEALQQAFDPYAVVRNAYVARREYLVRDGNIPEETYDEPIDEAPSSSSQEPPEQPAAQPSQAPVAPVAPATQAPEAPAPEAQPPPGR
jgi:phospholipid-binding lipoprotein MlaA